jgi:nickel transport protein
MCLGLGTGPGWAHKVSIFAWVDGDTVHTQSKFSGGKRPKDCTVVVYGMDGKQLLEGKTDENGEFSFKVPQKTGLKVVLKASMGHLAEWTIPAEEITGVADFAETSLPEIDVEAAGEETARLTDIKERTKPQVPPAAGLSRQEIQELIDKSLDRKLTPIVNMLAESLDRGPKVSEVVGGIGYIFGLVGVAFYFAARRRGNGKV